MAIPNITETGKKLIPGFVSNILESTKDIPSEIVLNGLLSAYFSAAVNRGFAADVPAALRAAANKVEEDLQKILSAKALIDAQNATAH